MNVATPMGMWHQSDDVMCDESDTKKLIEHRKKYGNILRNLWDPFDKKNEKVLGCNTINRLYITPLGDVLPCPYVHIKVGNIYENSLKEISDYGFNIKYFRDNSKLCLAGEDKKFAKSYLSKPGQSIFNPAKPEDIFSDDKFIDPEKKKSSTFIPIYESSKAT